MKKHFRKLLPMFQKDSRGASSVVKENIIWKLNLNIATRRGSNEEKWYFKFSARNIMNFSEFFHVFQHFFFHVTYSVLGEPGPEIFCSNLYTPRLNTSRSIQESRCTQCLCNLGLLEIGSRLPWGGVWNPTVFTIQLSLDTITTQLVRTWWPVI